jgi:hypothetical protein
MTIWTNPRTWNIGELVTKVIMDTHVRDNLLHLKETTDTLTAAAINFMNRKGGSSTDWTVQGSTDYTPSSPKIMTGVVRVQATSASGSIFFGTTGVTLPAGFTKKPIVICSQCPTGSVNVLQAYGQVNTTTSLTIGVTASASTANVDVSWIAIGE